MKKREEGEKGCRVRMVTWGHAEGKVWLLMLDKRHSHGDVKVSGGFGAWEQAKLSQKHPVKSPKEETWDLRDLRNSPRVAQQTYSCLLSHRQTGFCPSSSMWKMAPQLRKFLIFHLNAITSHSVPSALVLWL